MRIFLAMMMALAMLGGCAEVPDDADGLSGIEGTAMIGPTCAGPERDPPEPGCEDRPYEGELEVRRMPGGVPVHTFRPDADGMFRFAMDPGRYDIHSMSGTSLPACASPPFEVTSGTYTTIDVACDSGIR